MIKEFDSSSYRLDVTIYQDNGIGYASQTLSKTERSFGQTEIELLSLLFG